MRTLLDLSRSRGGTFIIGLLGGICVAFVLLVLTLVLDLAFPGGIR